MDLSQKKGYLDIIKAPTALEFPEALCAITKCKTFFFEDINHG